jgi:hypothetical protein
MTPEFKAKELIIKYQYAVRFDESETGYFANMHSVKECALILVNENIETLEVLNLDFDVSWQIKWWEHVKQEIEKLCELN